MNQIRRLYLEDFGILPDDGQNIAPFLRRAIEEAEALPGLCEINLRFGNYDIYADALIEKDIFVTNTDSGKDGDQITRHFAVLFDSVQNMILNGNPGPRSDDSDGLAELPEYYSEEHDF